MAKKVILKGEVQISDKGLKETTKGARSLDRRLKGAAATSSSATKNFSKMSQGISGGLVPAYATLAANIFAISAAFRFLKEQANLAILIEAQESYAASTGVALQSVTQRLRDASGGMLQFREASEAAAIGMAKGFSVDQLTSLAVGAQKAAAALGRSFEDAFDRLIKGTSKAEPELLDELGITLRLERATEEYGRAIGKNRDELTAWERSQAVIIETQRQLEAQFGGIDTVTNPFVALAATFDDIVRTVSQFFMPMMSGLASLISSSGIAAVAVFGALGLSIFKAALPMDTMKEKLNDWVQGHAAGVTQVENDLKGYREEIDKTKMSLEQMQDAAKKETGGIAGQMLKGKGGSKSKILQKMDRGETLTGLDKANLNKSLKSAEAQYKKHGKIKSGIFKGQNIEMVRDFKTSLGKLEVANKTTTKKMGMSFKRLSLEAKLRFKHIQGWGTTAMSAIGKGAIGMGKMMGKAMKFAGVIGMIIMVIEMVKKLLRSIYDIAISVLQFVDKVLNSGVGKGIQNTIAKVMRFVATGVRNIMGTVYGAIAGIINFIGEMMIKIADKMPDFLGAEKVKAAGLAVQSFSAGLAKVPGVIADTLDAAATALEKSAKEGSNLAETFASSSWGQGLLSIQTAMQDAETFNQTLEKVGDTIKSIKADSIGLAAGLSDSGLTGAQKTSKQAQAVSSLGISGALGDIFALSGKDEAKAGKKLKDLKAALEPLIDKIPVLAELMPLLDQPIDATTLQRYKDLETRTSASTAATNAFENSLQTLRKSSSGVTSAASLYGYLEQIKASKTLADQAQSSAEVIKGTTNVYNQLNKTLGGDADSVIVHLQSIRNENEEIKKQKMKLQLADSQAARLGTLRAKKQKELNNILKLELDQRKRLNDLEAARAAMEHIIGVEARATHAEKIAQMEYEMEIRKQQLLLEQKAITDIGKIGKVVSDNFETGMVTAFDAIVQGTKDVKQAFGDMAIGILKALANIINQLIAVAIAESVIGMFGGGGKKLTGDGGTGPLGDWKWKPGSSSSLLGSIDDKERYGGVVKPPPHMAAGGIASGRQAGYPAILHGTEAVVPLPQGGAIPVDLKGAGSSQSVVVNVNMAEGGETESQTEEGRGQEARQLGKNISAAVQRELQNQKRQGGMLNPHGVA